MTQVAIADGAPRSIGEVVEVQPSVGQYLIAIGRAVDADLEREKEAAEEGIAQAVPGGKRPRRKKK